LSNPVIILAIESSCDDTAAAVLSDRKVLSNPVANQKIHEHYGGVVPELASRAHQKNIVPVVDEALKQAGVSKKDLTAIAFTAGPGLLGSLLVGGAFAKSMALGLGVPLIGVHHMHAHILAHFIDQPDIIEPKFPFICLTVSGGHTQLVLMRSPLDMELLGQTLDDAAGEAFDKLAKMIGLPYPGGPEVDKMAKGGNPLKFTFGKPSISGLDFSFSGLKTSMKYFIERQTTQNPNFVNENLADICASGQHAITSILLEKITKAIEQYQITEVALAGGVSANSALREGLQKLAVKNGWHVHIPPIAYTTDNAAMIGIAAYYKYIAGLTATLQTPIEARKPFPGI
jgi:N6-L-threonylcarbamoyladenine synthase